MKISYFNSGVPHWRQNRFDEGYSSEGRRLGNRVPQRQSDCGVQVTNTQSGNPLRRGSCIRHIRHVILRPSLYTTRQFLTHNQNPCIWPCQWDSIHAGWWSTAASGLPVPITCWWTVWPGSCGRRPGAGEWPAYLHNPAAGPHQGPVADTAGGGGGARGSIQSGLQQGHETVVRWVLWWSQSVYSLRVNV